MPLSRILVLPTTLPCKSPSSFEISEVCPRLLETPGYRLLLHKKEEGWFLRSMRPFNFSLSDLTKKTISIELGQHKTKVEQWLNTEDTENNVEVNEGQDIHGILFTSSSDVDGINRELGVCRRF